MNRTEQANHISRPCMLVEAGRLSGSDNTIGVRATAVASEWGANRSHRAYFETQRTAIGSFQ
jgi:hypothetical protein